MQTAVLPGHRAYGRVGPIGTGGSAGAGGGAAGGSVDPSGVKLTSEGLLHRLTKGPKPPLLNRRLGFQPTGEGGSNHTGRVTCPGLRLSL